ncbi:MAG: solute carrier family 26 protein [Rhodothermales bacterium]
MHLRNVLPITDWLPSYSKADARSDLRAGLTVGVMIIPQSMAYAVLLGVPPIYGLYASLVPLFIYPLFGTSRQLAVGVIAIDMLVAGSGLALVAQPGTERYISLAILLAMMAGIMQLLMGFLRLGFIVNLLSRPVISGFTSAAALVICFSQIDHLLGVELPHTQYVFVLAYELLGAVTDLHPLSALIGTTAIFLLVLIRRWKPLFPTPLVIVLLGTLAVWLLDLSSRGIDVVGEIPAGLPTPSVPTVDVRSLRVLLPTAITLGLIQFMAVISLSKVFAAKHRYRLDANGELIALGLSNVLGSFFRSIPVSGSFSRSAVNDQAGARSPLANVVAALLVGATLLFFTPLFEYVPMAALSAIIIVAAFGLVNVQEIKLLIHMKRVDGAIALFTFGATLIAGVLEGILLGIGASVVAIMYRISRPNIAALGHLPGTQSFGDFDRHEEARSVEDILILRVDASLSFANSEYLRDYILQRTVMREGGPKIIIIDAHSINDVDTTAVELLLDLVDTLRSRGVDLYFGGTKGAVADVMFRAGLVDKLGRDHFYVSSHEAVRQVLTTWERHEGYIAATEEQVDLPGRADRPQEMD